VITQTDYRELSNTVELDSKGNTAMLLQENLARTRMRESQRAAANHRLARRLQAAHRWRRLATWAERHAARSARAL
jgi:hypothetical protein